LQLIIHKNWAPSRIVVERDETYFMLQEACRQLDISLEMVEKLEAMPEIKEEIAKGNLGRPL